MATTKLSDFVSRLGQAVPEPEDSTADAELLARFVRNRDEEAFARIVRRYGPLVFGVCRRTTGHHHLAEDAFQAVFVVLAAKAASIRPPSALPAWLYGVAHRVALRARTMSDRRRRRETHLESSADVASKGFSPTDSSDLVMLDAEIARLPEHLRFAVLMCEIEGRSRTEVAVTLKIAEGTLSSRLASARKKLASRLRQRGVALSAAGLTASLAQITSASVPSQLASTTVRTALSGGLARHSITTLSQGVLRMMYLEKLRMPLVALIVLSSAAFAGTLLWASEPPREPAPRIDPPVVHIDAPAASRAAAEKPQPKGPNKLLVYRAGHLTLLDPDGKNEQKVSQDRGKFHPGDSHLSPDGKLIAVLHQVNDPREGGESSPRRKLYVRKLDEKEPGTDLGVECQMFFWSADGTEIAFSEFVDGREKKLSATHGIVNVRAKEKTALKLPESHIITDWSADGKQFLTTAVDGPDSPQNLPTARLYLVNRDGSELKALTREKGFCAGGRLAPDGSRILFMEMEMKEGKGEPPTLDRRKLKVLNVKTGKAAEVSDTPLNGEIQSFCWSPDGKRIAYAWREVHTGKPDEVAKKETESFLVVCDPDGKNARTIATEKAEGQWTITIGHIDWR